MNVPEEIMKHTQINYYYNIHCVNIYIYAIYKFLVFLFRYYLISFIYFGENICRITLFVFVWMPTKYKDMREILKFIIEVKILLVIPLMQYINRECTRDPHEILCG